MSLLKMMIENLEKDKHIDAVNNCSELHCWYGTEFGVFSPACYIILTRNCSSAFWSRSPHC